MGKDIDWSDILDEIDRQVDNPMSPAEARDNLMSLRDDLNVRIAALEDDVGRDEEDEG